MKKVFISYAREDIETARKLYHDLKKAGLDPWMGDIDLLPGQRWKTEVEKAIKKASFFITLISENSVSKKGVAHRELKKALEILEEYPSDDIFIVPARLDDCEVSYKKLHNIRWIDLFPNYNEGLREILQSFAVDKQDIEAAIKDVTNTQTEPVTDNTTDRIVKTIEGIVKTVKGGIVNTIHSTWGMRIVKGEPKGEKLDDVQFTSFFPKEIRVNIRYSLFVYAHLKSLTDEIEKDVQQFIDKMGGEFPKSETAVQSARLKPGTRVIVVPECDEIEFAPVSLTRRWNGTWIRFGFDFMLAEDFIDESLFIRISIQVSGIEIAHIRFTIDINNKPLNPLALAKIAKQSSDMYRNIFVSYSKKDLDVVEIYRFAQLAIGNDVFMDTYSIISGDNRKAALAEAIDKADIFQLFWSENSGYCSEVRYEWDYALKYRCPHDKCIFFIRPVFWKKPLSPEPPDELGHLNFRYVPLPIIKNEGSGGSDKAGIVKEVPKNEISDKEAVGKTLIKSDFEFKFKLVNSLLSCSCISDRNSRTSVINELRKDIKHGIPRSPVDRVDVVNIVNRCFAFSDGINELIRVVHMFEGDSIYMQEVYDLLKDEKPELKAEAGKVQGDVYKLRSEPKTLSDDDVMELIKKHNFYCGKYSWSEKWHNESGNFKNDFKDNGDSTVTDRLTDLMWQKSDSDNYMTHNDAKVYIDDLNSKKFAEYSDWRLPTLEELASLLGNDSVSSCYIAPVFESRAHCYWVADKRAFEGCWCIDIRKGFVGWNRLFLDLYVRAVRSLTN
ncbi:MAG: TIR domain-containing protein [Desulfobacterales bacterium]|nr:TIR domain-containing protein [Desulfobacterales bacterium]